MNLLDIASAALAEFRRGATATSPAADSRTVAATPEQATELRALVAIVAAAWPESERAEALAVALSDPEAALTSFRLLAHDAQEQAIWGRHEI